MKTPQCLVLAALLPLLPGVASASASGAPGSATPQPYEQPRLQQPPRQTLPGQSPVLTPRTPQAQPNRPQRQLPQLEREAQERQRPRDDQEKQRER